MRGLNAGGGRIVDLRLALNAEIRPVCQIYPVNLLVCIGLNDLIQGSSIDQMKGEVMELKEEFLTWNERNVINFITVPFAPKICQLKGNNFFIEKGMDRGRDIFEYNDFLIRQNGMVTPTLHDKGVEREGENYAAHVQELWREFHTRTILEGLHLTDEVRGKVWAEIEVFFQNVEQ